MTVATNRYSSAGLNGFTTAARRGLTPADLAYISVHRAKGRGWQSIANMMGRPRADIERAAEVEAYTRARPRVFSWTPEHIETARVYYRAGNNPTMLAIKVGCSIEEADQQLAHQRALAVERNRLALNERRREKHAVKHPPKPKPEKPVAPGLPFVRLASPSSSALTFPAPVGARPTPLQVVALTAETCGLTLEAMCRRSSERHRVHARWIAAWLIKKYCERTSYPEIARVLGGFDHTTIVSGVARLEELVARGIYADALCKLSAELARPASNARLADARATFSKAMTDRAQVLKDAA